MEALAAAQERQGTAEEHVRQLEASLEEKTAEMTRLVVTLTFKDYFLSPWKTNR